MENLSAASPMKTSDAPSDGEEDAISEMIESLAKSVLGNGQFTIDDYDLDRVYGTMDGDGYVIRMWDISKQSVRWTLFRMLASHGETVRTGTYNY